MLYEFAPKVVVTAAPEETTEAFCATGRATEFPPVMLKLPEAIDKVGCGTLIL
jgi:hypothetical protein